MLNRWFILVCVFATLPIVAAAQPPEETPPIALALIPAAEPVPALKYRLLPDLREQTSGNAMQLYYRAFSPESQSFRREKNWREPFEKALEAPLKDLKSSDVSWLRESNFLREVDRGARKVTCDWDLKDRLRDEGYRLLLPDVQGLRDFARLLAVRARLEMADGQFDQAAYSLRSGFALARHMGEGPTLIQALVGFASVQVVNKQIETWVQTPGSPNLYWSLTDLPSSLVELRKGLQGERIVLDYMLPDIRECLADPARPAKSLAELRNMLKRIEELDDNRQIGVALRAMGIAAKYPAAKKFLAERGWIAAQIEAVPAIQAVLMQEVFEYDRYFDNNAKALNLPFPQAQAILRTNMNELGASRQQSLAVPSVAELLLPGLHNVLAAKIRLDRQMAAFRVIEAIRMHAAANGNKLPASLDAIKIVPVPLDPATNAPFGYSLAGEKAILSAEFIPGGRGNPQNRLRYELTIAQ